MQRIRRRAGVEEAVRLATAEDGDPLRLDNTELREERRGDRRGIGYYRRDASYDAWLRNLADHDADRLFVFPLPLHARTGEYVRDDLGFPLEAQWARDHPGRFREIRRSAEVLVYEVTEAP